MKIGILHIFATRDRDTVKLTIRLAKTPEGYCWRLRKKRLGEEGFVWIATLFEIGI